MDCRERIISDFAARECERVAGRVIRKLQTITDALLLGEDSGLRNAWDEICVQVQSVESLVWDIYVDEMMRLVSIELETVPRFVLEAVWLQTDPGFDWLFDYEYDNKEPILRRGTLFVEEKAPFSKDDIAGHIVHKYVLEAADRWHNRRIEAYLDSMYRD